MQPGYIEAIVPDAYTILGIRLLPFSLGHLNLLTRFDVAFATGGIPNERDLLTGIVVCSQNYREGYEFLTTTGWEREVTRWGEKLLKMNWLKRRLGIQPKRIEWAGNMRLFIAYFNEGMANPPTIPIHSNDTRTSTSPWQEILMAFALKSMPGKSREQILDMPLAWLRWQHAVEQEMAGVVRFKTKDDLERERLAAEMEAEVAAAAQGEVAHG